MLQPIGRLLRGRDGDDDGDGAVLGHVWAKEECEEGTFAARWATATVMKHNGQDAAMKLRKVVQVNRSGLRDRKRHTYGRLYRVFFTRSGEERLGRANCVVAVLLCEIFSTRGAGFQTRGVFAMPDESEVNQNLDDGYGGMDAKERTLG